MIYTPLTKKALKIAYQAHHGQLDRNGLPYIFHPFHLAEQMEDEVSAAAALLHDVIEDTDWTENKLRKAGFPPEVLELVSLLTHDETVPYMEYIRAIADSHNPAAKKIKLADLEHNSDLSRLDEITENDRLRMKKYQTAREFLLSADNTDCKSGRKLV